MDPIIDKALDSYLNGASPEAARFVSLSTASVFRAGWEACRRHYDGLNQPPLELLPTGDSEAVTSPADIYEAYPRHEGRGAALKAISKALRTRSALQLMTATKAYAAAVALWPRTARYTKEGTDTVPHASTWFNQERYLDDPKVWVRGTPTVGIKVSQ